MKAIYRDWPDRGALKWVLLFGLVASVAWNVRQWFGWGGVEGSAFVQAFIYLAWVFCFRAYLTGSNIPWKRSAKYFLAAGILGGALAVILSLVVLLAFFGEIETAMNDYRTMGAAMLASIGLGALSEEIGKVGPLLIFGLGKNQIRSEREGLILGFISGAGFGTFEAFLAALSTNSVAYIILQFVGGPLIHGAWSGIVGWSIGMAKCRQRSRGVIIVIGILLAAFLHSLVNTFAFIHMPGVAFSFELMSLLLFTMLLLREPARFHVIPAAVRN